MESFFVFLYPLVGIMSVVGYLPQIKTLIYAKSKPSNISISSWYMWCLTAGLTLGYGVTYLQDFMFIVTSAVNFTLCISTTGLIFYNLYFRFEIYDKSDLTAVSQGLR